MMSISAKEIEQYFDRLWPILRSLTGKGVRDTHQILSEIIPLQSMEIPSGTEVFDWKVPLEWKINEAYVIRPDGKKILDIKENSLHLLNPSYPFRGTVSLKELNQRLYSIESMPQAIPYVTKYYGADRDSWGFCISHEERMALPEGNYEVVIDSELFPGSMTLSECVLPGREKKEILFSTYTCHPSMANNELSGPLVTAFLYKLLSQMKDRKYTYRFLFLPETIGSIAYLSKFGNRMKENVVAGYVVTCIGDAGNFTYKRSRQKTSLSDRAAENVLKLNAKNYEVQNFAPNGSDERQYCSQGFNLPIGSLMRTQYGKYPEYHTSLDNKSFVSFEAMKASVEMYYKICEVLELNESYINLMPHCEPHLSKRDLYPKIGGAKEMDDELTAMMWVLNYSDGNHDLIDISEMCGLPLQTIAKPVKSLLEKKVITLRQP